MSHNDKNKKNKSFRCESASEDTSHVKKYIKSDLCLYKTVLSKCTIHDPDFIITTFDITILNKMDDKIINVSLKDSLIGLKIAIDDIRFDVISSSDNLIPLNNNEIIEHDGELLNVHKSTLPPRSASRLLLRVTAKQELTCDDDKIKCTLNICNNSITLNAKIRIINEHHCSITEEAIEPIYLCSNASI